MIKQSLIKTPSVSPHLFLRASSLTLWPQPMVARRMWSKTAPTSTKISLSKAGTNHLRFGTSLSVMIHSSSSSSVCWAIKWCSLQITLEGRRNYDYGWYRYCCSLACICLALYMRQQDNSGKRMCAPPSSTLSECDKCIRGKYVHIEGGWEGGGGEFFTLRFLELQTLKNLLFCSSIICLWSSEDECIYTDLGVTTPVLRYFY